jgi:hypothetical protein
MAMADATADRFRRFWRLGGRRDVRLLRLTGAIGGNVYEGEPVEFASDGSTMTTGEPAIEVTNLAESSAGAAALAEGAEVLAIDVEGRWVAYAAPASAATMLARVQSADGGASYTVVEQVVAAGGFADAPGAAAVSAQNLAEIDLGPGAGVDSGAIVLVAASADGAGQVHYLFDRPVYAKYLD